MGTLDRVLLWSSVCQALEGPASLLFSCWCWRVGREAMVKAPPTMHDSAVSLASVAAWLSSTGISHHDMLPHVHSIRLSAVNGSPHPGIAPQSLNSSSQLLPLPGDQFLPGVCMASARTVWWSFHLVCHRWAVSLSALNVSSLIQTIGLLWGLDPHFSSRTH